MKYAVIKLAGKQYKVKPGDVIETERLDFKPKDKFTIEDILLTVSDTNTNVGTPKVKGAKVKATVLDNIRGEKIRVSKFKAKVRYRRAIGHRQSLSKVQIDDIAISN